MLLIDVFYGGLQKCVLLYWLAGTREKRWHPAAAAAAAWCGEMLQRVRNVVSLNATHFVLRSRSLSGMGRLL